jgi:hypothetical protein
MNGSGYNQYTCPGDTICCPPSSPTDGGINGTSACLAAGGKCIACPPVGPNAGTCDGALCCVLGARQCPCQGAGDCDTDAACVSGVCQPTTLPECGGLGHTCCGGWCGSCVKGTCINSICQ